jgi:hypothetical protein
MLVVFGINALGIILNLLKLGSAYNTVVNLTQSVAGFCA